MKRQQRKLNFLITQTELYAHFMARKITGATDKDKERILSRLSEENTNPKKQREVKGGVLLDEAGDNYGLYETSHTKIFYQDSFSAKFSS